MGQIIIRNLEEDVIEGLKLRASLEGKSLEQLMREVAKAAVPLTGEARGALVRRLQALTPKGVSQTDSTILIREDRDSR